MEKEYLRSFIIGASLLPTLPYLLGLLILDDKYKNFSNKDFEVYVITTPIYFGIMNALSLYFSKKYDWSLKERLIYAGILSAIISTIQVILHNPYNYTQWEWTKYHIRQMITNFLTFTIIIYLLEKNM